MVASSAFGVRAPESTTTARHPRPAMMDEAADHATTPSGSETAPPGDDDQGLGSGIPGVSEVTLVEVTLLGDLVRVLRATEGHQAAIVEQEKLANAHRAALVDAQRAAVAHQAALLEQQRALTASTIRSELRAYNNVSSMWKALPLLNGDPFPVAEVNFPSDLWQLRKMTVAEVRRVAAMYEIGYDGCDVDGLRDSLALFICGKRS